MRDELITTRPVPIAARDFGGTGTPVLLVHGLGGTVDDWMYFAGLLTVRHRVVAVDLRGHGGSGDGPWEWDAILDDLAAAVEHLGLTAPAVVGMSLGGWVAALWARRHPECPAVVNLDGHRSALTRREHYLGMDDAALDADLARLREMFDAPPPGPMNEAQVTKLREQHRSMAEESGTGAGQAMASFDRQLVTRGDGTYLRPEAAMLAGIRAALDTTDMFAVFAEIRVPFLLIVGTEDMPAQRAFADLTAAFRRGLDRDIAALQRRRPEVAVERITASHAMLWEVPDELAARVEAFLTPL